MEFMDRVELNDALEQMSIHDEPEILFEAFDTLLNSIELLASDIEIYMANINKESFVMKVSESKNKGYYINEIFTNDFAFFINLMSSGNPGRAVILSGILIKLRRTGIIENYLPSSIKSASTIIMSDFSMYYNAAYHRTREPRWVGSDSYAFVWEDIVNL